MDTPEESAAEQPRREDASNVCAMLTSGDAGRIHEALAILQADDWCGMTEVSVHVPQCNVKAMPKLSKPLLHSHNYDCMPCLCTWQM